MVIAILKVYLYSLDKELCLKIWAYFQREWVNKRVKRVKGQIRYCKIKLSTNLIIFFFKLLKTMSI